MSHIPSVKNVLLWVLIVSLVFALASVCFAVEKKYTVGVTIYSFNHKYTLRVLEGINKAAEKYNVEVIAIDSQDDQAKQVADTEALIARGVDGIIATPITTEGGQEVVNLANEAGIPITCVSRRVPSGEYVYIGSDDVEAGRMAVRYFAEKLNGKGKVAMVMGTMGSSSEIDRSLVWHEELKNYPGLECVAEITGQFFRDGGLKATEDILTAHPDVQAIWYQNDDMLLGGIVALEGMGKLGKVITLGVDGDPEAIQAIKDGKADATLFQEAEFQGGFALGLLVLQLEGRSVNGYETKFSIVDKNNVFGIFPSEDNLAKTFPY
ncbi:sugar ABC transporter substrate-binding protein [Atrimonas thermophila]|uniref:sugar ABC transporter substrate-binding protein n=1 Tax=Atrimonas thermophila TaxID=3064161 RepID=UPI00399CCA5F